MQFPHPPTPMLRRGKKTACPKTHSGLVDIVSKSQGDTVVFNFRTFRSPSGHGSSVSERARARRSAGFSLGTLTVCSEVNTTVAPPSGKLRKPRTKQKTRQASGFFMEAGTLLICPALRAQFCQCLNWACLFPLPLLPSYIPILQFPKTPALSR